MTNYIRNKKVEKGRFNDVLGLKGFSEVVWSFISSIYKSGWDTFYSDKENRLFRQKFGGKFTLNISKNNPSANRVKYKDKAAEIIKLPPPILVRLSKEVLEKSKFFKKGKNQVKTVKLNNKQSYAQAVNSKITDILKLKENNPNLPVKKIKNIHKIINNSNKPKPRIKITTKGSLQKQIIILMGNDNKTRFMALFSSHITNLNRVLKNIKLDIVVDYIYPEQNITIVTNQVVSSSDLQVIKNYVKNVDNINSEDIESFYLP